MKLAMDIDYLEELLKHESNGLVRKILKRHEIFGAEDKRLKNSVKELIHEEFRTLFSLLISAGRGVEKSYFELKSRDE